MKNGLSKAIQNSTKYNYLEAGTICRYAVPLLVWLMAFVICKNFFFSTHSGSGKAHKKISWDNDRWSNYYYYFV